ncbi:MarR family transcriptional regulator [Paenibacillus selenitireducens]|uniref:HTH-type transcriptional regulator SarZ n=1 Tax=Paenibacillus selenitireducens TaxID=1324314 RepID=A0A1T2X3Y0_9BACL|nr:MarR family transcriptional regulator [Paenibacillus selenitireducens]OPA74604.1 MarR family transcriptional regulator [Paenibacillus selenitireducens]
MEQLSDHYLRLDQQLCFALYTCEKEMTKLYRPLLEDLGLTYTQYITMLALWEKDEISVKTLGQKLFLDSGTLTPLLKRLEASGLLRRERDAQDERVVIVRLTEQGIAMKQQACAIPLQIVHRTQLSPEELIKLRDELTQLTNILNQYTEEES